MQWIQKWSFFVALLVTACLITPAVVGAQTQKNGPDDKGKTVQKTGAASKAAKLDGAALTLEEALEFALQHNLKKTLAEQEMAIEEERLTGAKWRMLPKLLLDAELSWRDRDVPSKSVNASTGETSLDPSISSDQEKVRSNLTLSWDLLDFAIALNQRRSMEHQVAISGLKLKRARQKIILEVTRAYMHAAAAWQILELSRQVAGSLKKELASLRKRAKKNLINKAASLDAEVRYLGQMVSYQDYQRTFNAAMVQLARGMGAPDTPNIRPMDFFKVTAPQDLKGDDFKDKMAAYEKQAIAQRPEIQQVAHEQSITDYAARRALWKLYPKVEPFVKATYDHNSFLDENHWFTIGLNLSWDILSIPQARSRHKAVLLRRDRVETQQHLTAAAILAQVRLAFLDLAGYAARHGAMRLYAKRSAELVKTMRKLVKNGKRPNTELLTQQQRHLAVMTEYLNHCVRLKTAQARLDNSLGME
jgi:outer membrane protein TolC